MNRSEELIECLEGEIAARDVRIAKLEAERNDPEFSPKYSRRLIAELRAELAALREQVPVAFSQSLITKDYQPVKPGADSLNGYVIPLYAAPVAKPQSDQGADGSASQKSFWAGFEYAKCYPDELNIRSAWNDFKTTDTFMRHCAADHIEQPRAMVVPDGAVLVGRAELSLVRNAMALDAEQGRPVRGEMLIELDRSISRFDAMLSAAPAPGDSQ